MWVLVVIIQTPFLPFGFKENTFFPYAPTNFLASVAGFISTVLVPNIAHVLRNILHILCTESGREVVWGVRFACHVQ